MGYNTPVLIVNDALQFIDQNPHEFVAGLVRACETPMFTGHLDIPAGPYVNAAQALMHRHADEYRVMVSQGNWLWEVRAGSEHNVDPYITRALSGDDHLRHELVTRCQVAKNFANRVLDALGE